MRALTLVVAIWAVAGSAFAVSAPETLDDPVLEARARAIGKELRCLVCQNQSIDDSNADLAKDLRRIVRERLVAGDSDAVVKDFMVARYGDFVLLKPPFKSTTYVLWLGPAVILLLGGASAVVYVRRQARQPQPAAPLTADERKRLKRLLDDAS